MARNAPISVKDLTAALSIGREEGKKDALVAERSSPYAPFNKDNNPSSYGDDTIEDEPGTDPAEMIQLELPLESVKKLKIMAQDNPEIAQSIMDGLKISSENEDDYAPGSKNHPQTPGKPWQIANISDSIKRENVGGTLRDLVLPAAMKEYGKTPGGGYKNPGALLSIMKKLV